MSQVDGDRLMEDGGKACGDISHRFCPVEEVSDVNVQTTGAVERVATEQDQRAPLPTGVTTEETRGNDREGNEEAEGMEKEVIEVTASSEGVVVSRDDRYTNVFNEVEDESYRQGPYLSGDDDTRQPDRVDKDEEKLDNVYFGVEDDNVEEGSQEAGDVEVDGQKLGVGLYGYASASPRLCPEDVVGTSSVS